MVPAGSQIRILDEDAVVQPLAVRLPGLADEDEVTYHDAARVDELNAESAVPQQVDSGAFPRRLPRRATGCLCSRSPSSWSEPLSSGWTSCYA
jgi:hypothetical protein